MKKIVLIGVAPLLMLACKTEKSPETKEVETSSKERKEMVYETTQTDAQFKTPAIAQVYADYNTLKAAFVNTDREKAQQAAGELESSLGKLEGMEKFKTAVETIAQTDNINKQRDAFPEVTAGMLSLVTGNLDEGTLYYQYCPMAFQGKGGYWISSEKEVNNPYFGDKMLHCGTVDREIE